MKIQIRRPKLKDKKELFDFFQLVIKDTFQRENISEFYPGEITVEVQKVFQVVLNDLEGSGREEYVLLAQTGNQIAGTIAFGFLNDIIKNNIKAIKNSFVLIKGVYVLPEIQNQGLGSRLFETLLGHLKQKSVPGFYLDCGYPSAQQFWIKKLGPPFLILKNQWGENQDHYIWEVSLSVVW